MKLLSTVFILFSVLTLAERQHSNDSPQAPFTDVKSRTVVSNKDDGTVPKKIDHYKGYDKASHLTHNPHWGYKKDLSKGHNIPPSEWYKLNEACREHQEGSRQSPIDIPTPVTPPKKDASLPDTIKLDYFKSDSGDYEEEGAVVFDVFHNQHTIQATVSDKNSSQQSKNSLDWNNETFHLKQFHIHSKSEHTVDGKHSPLEIHFVHQSADGKSYTVLGVMVEIADKSDVDDLGSIIQSYDPKRNFETPVRVPIRILNLLPKNRSRYISYDGSLTTPPCTETVNWILFQEPLKLSKRDFEMLRVHGFDVGFENNRPVQNKGTNTNKYNLKYHW